MLWRKNQDNLSACSMLSAPEDCSSGEEMTLQNALEQILDEFDDESREKRGTGLNMTRSTSFQQSSKSSLYAYFRSRPFLNLRHFRSKSFEICLRKITSGLVETLTRVAKENSSEVPPTTPLFDTNSDSLIVGILA